MWLWMYYFTEYGVTFSEYHFYDWLSEMKNQDHGWN